MHCAQWAAAPCSLSPDRLSGHWAVLKQVLLAVGKQYCGDGWTELEWGVRTGGLCFERIHGAPFFEHMPTVPGAMDVFCKAMHAMDSIGETGRAYPPWDAGLPPLAPVMVIG